VTHLLVHRDGPSTETWHVICEEGMVKVTEVKSFDDLTPVPRETGIHIPDQRMINGMLAYLRQEHEIDSEFEVVWDTATSDLWWRLLKDRPQEDQPQTLVLH
jgi:hypothetical protein